MFGLKAKNKNGEFIVIAVKGKLVNGNPCFIHGEQIYKMGKNKETSKIFPIECVGKVDIAESCSFVFSERFKTEINYRPDSGTSTLDGYFWYIRNPANNDVNRYNNIAYVTAANPIHDLGTSKRHEKDYDFSLFNFSSSKQVFFNVSSGVKADMPVASSIPRLS